MIGDAAEERGELVDGDGDITGEPLVPRDGTAAVAAQRGERAGLYLAAVVALAVPSLIVLALFLPTGSPLARVDLDDAARNQAELDSVNVTAASETQSSDGVPVVVGGAGQAQGDVTIDIGEPAGVIADVQVAGPTDSSAIPDPPRQETSVATTVTAATVAPNTTVTPTTVTPTTVAPNTTVAPTTTEATTTTTTVAEEPDPDIDPPAFAQRVDIGRIGETTLQFRFMSAEDSDYTTTIRSGSDVVVRTSGDARANALINELVQDLNPGTSYSVQVELAGQPSAQSPRVAFRTAGGETVDAVDEQAEVQNLRLEQVDETRFEVRYESNICANGSFVIREQAGAVVGRNSGQASGCTTRHLGIPGFWTAPLEPNTTYVIIVQVEAGGAGRGDGNVASRSLTVTTTG